MTVPLTDTNYIQGGKRILLKKMKEDTVEDVADVHIPAVDLEKQVSKTKY